MNNTAAICTTPVLPTQSPLLQRWAGHLNAAWQSWRTRARLNDELRALDGLSDGTLRDIGLAERVLQQPTLSVLDYERGRW
jgi:uncharacterized protein YjiS (DUF1127 family)